MAKPLPTEPHAAALDALPEWTHLQERHALARRFLFKDFAQAFAFMTQAALLAEKMDHHPEWANVYNRVDVVLTTHDAHGVTDKDFKMARAMDDIARHYDAKG
jgi:4a-hydroxytetrahydrobiopterin dehydratase